MATDPQRWYGPTPARRVARIYDILAEHIEPTSDLEYDDHFQLLIAVVLSAQATDRSVNRATRGLFAEAAHPQAMLDLGLAGIIAHIRSIGLYNAKARNIMALCQMLVDHHGGEVPNTRAALEALPGVGSKTASVVLNIAFGQPTIAVDTHVHRVANRLGITACRSVQHSEQVLLQRTPRRHLLHAHHYLILHGRYTCTARNPHCQQCPLARLCPSAGTMLAATRAPTTSTKPRSGK